MADEDYPDEARRLADAVNLHITAIGPGSATGKWVAARLSDGRSDGVLYDTKADAIRHQVHEQLCVYVCIPPTGMNARQANAVLTLNRQLYDAGMRLIDPDSPDGGRSVHVPMTYNPRI